MTDSSSGLMYRVRTSVEQWMHNRWQECIHCRECDSQIKPFATHCPTCGQANPAKVSATAAIRAADDRRPYVSAAYPIPLYTWRSPY